MHDRVRGQGQQIRGATDQTESEGAARIEARHDDLLTPGEVARMFGVDPKTVTRWAAAGKLEALRTLGGHRRYRAEEVHRLLDQRSGRGADAPDEASTNGHGTNGSSVLGRHETS